MYNMCIELEDDIFNMIELFARDKTLNAYLYQIGILPYFGKRKQVTYHPNLSYWWFHNSHNELFF